MVRVIKDKIAVDGVNYTISLLFYQIFRGNFERNFIVTHRFRRPFKARYVRIHPKSWRSHISMRLELYGCRLGKFRKVNSDKPFL